MKTPKEILIAAKALIDTPEKWTQSAYARDETGAKTQLLDDDAVCFCSLGAIGRACWQINQKQAEYDCILLLRKSICVDSIAPWNDASQRTHAEVMAAFDRAIAAADL